MKLHRIFAAMSLALIFTLTLGTLVARAAWDEEQGYDPSLGLARISYMTGDVLFYAPDTEEWAEASPNFALREDDSLWVGDDAKAEIRFATGETAWLNYQTGLDMSYMRTGPDGDTYQVGLPYGEASFNVKNYDVLGSVFQVDTPSASVRAFGRALFRVSSLDDGTTQIGVRDGSVEVESEYGVLSLRPGDLMEVYPSGRSRVMELPREDSWDDWVDARMDRYTRSYKSSKYLPREMYSYADEFEENGSWVSYPEYGNVWVPRVSVGWSPYSYGRWVYVGYDYVWLPYDPWYAPYHYGRWYWDVGFGWFWIPPSIGFTYWSPGYVGWCYGPDYLYWVPLGPGEIYYGHGYYGPRNVNIYIHKDVHIKNVYINSRVKNSVTVVDRHEFSKGRIKRVTIKDSDNPFRNKVRDTTIIGRAPTREIKPDRKLRLPKPDKVVSERVKPPKKVIERVRTVKERKVVTRSQGSAFKDKQRPERMRDVDDTGRKPVWKQESERRKSAIEKPGRTGETDKKVREPKEAPETGKDTRTRKWDKVREPDTTKDRGRVKDTEEDKTRTWDRKREPATQSETPAIKRDRDTDRLNRRDEAAPSREKTDDGRGEQGTTRSRRWDTEAGDRPAAEPRTKTRETGTVGGTPGWGRSGGSTDTDSDSGRTGGKIYRETGSDRGSLRRDTGEDATKGSVKEPQPAVREGAGQPGRTKAVGKETTGTSPAKRKTAAERAKDKSGKEAGPDAESTEYVPADSGTTGTSGRGKSGQWKDRSGKE